MPENIKDTKEIDEIIESAVATSTEKVQQEEDSKQDSKITVVDKILNFFTGITNEERLKIRKLKGIDKNLRRLKYKFYNYKKDLILPALGEKCYELYRLSQNLSKYFDIKNHSKSIKQFIFELYSTQVQKELREKLEAEVIYNSIKNSKDAKQSILEIKKTVNDYVKSFTPEAVKKINTTYNQIVHLSYITTHDWYYFLHKFDSNITETDFNYKPEFESLEGKYVQEDLITINDYLETLDFSLDWKNVIDYLKSMSDDEALLNIFKKILQLSRLLKRDEYLLMIIKLISKNPYFKPKKFPSDATIVQDYIHQFQAEVESTINKVIKEIKKSKIDTLLLSIFNKTAIVRLKNYNQRINDLLSKKGVNGVKFIDPLNYLKAFLLDYCKGEIKPRIDLLLIKGTWSTNSYSSEYSSLLDHINQLSNMITEFDNSCSEDENYGKSLRKLVFAISHDPNAKVLLKKTIYKIDSEANELINNGIKILLTAANKIKVLIDDYTLKTPKIIVDFKKITWEFPGDPMSDLSEINKKINNFVSLMKYYIKGSSEEKKETENPGKP